MVSENDIHDGASSIDGSSYDNEDDSTGSSDDSSTHESSSSSISCERGNHRTIKKNDSSSKEIESWDLYSSAVRDWTEKVPIGMNLCPWAKLSHEAGRIRYVTCHETIQTPELASDILWKEIDEILGGWVESEGSEDGTSHRRSLPAWSTTLVICPHVEAWKTDFKAFESFVDEFGKLKRYEKENEAESSSPSSRPPDAYQGDHRGIITLVPFHPRFVRWRGLPETIATGSQILCHRGLAGFSKSQEAHRATVVDLRPPGFGRRRIRVRFLIDDHPAHGDKREEESRRVKTEQCIPLDWVVSDGESGASGGDKLTREMMRPPLPDNAMHRSPYPAIHIIRNEDLASLSIHDISRLKRRNANRMASEGL